MKRGNKFLNYAATGTVIIAEADKITQQTGNRGTTAIVFVRPGPAQREAASQTLKLVEKDPS